MLTSQSILQHLPADFRQIFIAYSGGVDSQVLLHLCAGLPQLIDHITAVYIHHGLQADADDWLAHCQRQCQNFKIKFIAMRVNAQAKPGESPEDAARSARYQALKSLLHSGDLLLLAHHREDQLETVLLQLFRGAGVDGLAAMPVTQVIEQALMLRPLLEVPKNQLIEYALHHQLQWVEDPSNVCIDYDRNFLRSQVIPLLKTRWPALDKTVARSALHCANASYLLKDWANQQLVELLDSQTGSLQLDKWQLFNTQQQNCLLRAWLHRFIDKSPSQALLQSIVMQVINASTISDPALYLQGFYLRKYQNNVYCFPANYFIKQTAAQIWDEDQPAFKLLNDHYLIRISAQTGIAKQLWHQHSISVSARIGGEKIKLPGRKQHHSLKKLYQEANIPPWERELRPLIYINNQLAAVAGLWVAEWAYAKDADNCYQILWQKQS